MRTVNLTEGNPIKSVSIDAGPTAQHCLEAAIAWLDLLLSDRRWLESLTHPDRDHPARLIERAKGQMEDAFRTILHANQLLTAMQAQPVSQPSIAAAPPGIPKGIQDQLAQFEKQMQQTMAKMREDAAKLFEKNPPS